jgi:nucleolar protein 4
MLSSCRLVFDKSTGKPKGTAFVEFKDRESAIIASADCQKARCAVAWAHSA